MSLSSRHARGRGQSERLGLAVHLCTLPWLGFVPDDVRSAPPVAVARLAARLGVNPGVLAGYGERDKTPTIQGERAATRPSSANPSSRTA
jgi:hypothetical protein